MIVLDASALVDVVLDQGSADWVLEIRVVDGLYVALADELGCPLVTTDRQLAGTCAPCEVRNHWARPAPACAGRGPRPTLE